MQSFVSPHFMQIPMNACDKDYSFLSWELKELERTF